MIKGIQVVGILVSLFLLAQAVLNYRRGNYSWRRAVFFSGLWVLVAFLFVYPGSVQFVMPILTTQDMIASVLVVGMIVVFALISELYQQVGRVERKLAELVQNLAIRDYLSGESGGEGKDV